jgi:hypothetical protein
VLVVVLPHLDRILFSFANVILVYYLVFGLATSLFFGSIFDLNSFCH